MATDFFKDTCHRHKGKNCQEYISSNVFGICDEDAQPHAYINTSDPSIWVVSVNNDNNVNVLFVPIDKSLNILREDGSIDSTCDAMLVYTDNIVFVELKDKQPPWVSKAIEQLKNTIYIFDQYHGLGNYKKRRAFASNKNAPGYAYNMQDEMELFKNETRVRLIISADKIII